MTVHEHKRMLAVRSSVLKDLRTEAAKGSVFSIHIYFELVRLSEIISRGLLSSNSLRIVLRRK